MLITFFNNGAAADKLCATLFYKADKTFKCIADSKKVINDKHFVTRIKELFANHNIVGCAVSKRLNRCGENITGTMEKVEGMMATIVLAFEKQLDSLFGDQAMDISTDITVLDNMMAREGLTGGDAVHQAAQENPGADPQPELDIRNAGDAQTQPPQAEDSVDAGNGITLEL